MTRSGELGRALAAEFVHLWSEAVNVRQARGWTARRIVSGGQTGVDRAALDWAIANNIDHGGWCPRGRRAEDGAIPAAYHLEEMESEAPADRTEANVRDSDGTLLFSVEPELSGGTLLTHRVAMRLQRPWLHVVEADGPDAADAVVEFLGRHRIRTLNVAGPRASEAGSIGRFVTEILSRAYALAK
jgi:hypothetical protein